MKLTPEQIDGLVNLIGITRESELNCEECLDRVAEFAEIELADRPVPEALKSVEHHLSLCIECREEYQTLLKALANLNDQAEEG